MAGLTARLGLPLRGRLVVLEEGGSVGVALTQAGQVVGRLRVTSRGGWLAVPSLCVEPGMRGHGLGSEALDLRMQAAAGAGYRGLMGWAPAGGGLAVYFWLRCGLRPTLGHRSSQGLWFERRLGED